MKTAEIRHAVLMSVTLLFYCDISYAQGGGVNFGFEQAMVPNLGPGQSTNLPFAKVFPGWVGYLGSSATSEAYYNTISEGSVSISLIGHNTQYESNYVISGNYTAVLQAGQGNNALAAAAIAQTVTVPLDSLSIQFAAVGSVFGDVGNLVLSFDGQDIPFGPLMAVSNYEVYGGNISQFAGSTGELRFTENPTASDPFATAYLDSIAFSTSPVPEPATCALILAGIAFLALKKASQRP